MSRGRRAVGLAVAGLALGAVACAGGSGTEVKGTGDELPVAAGAADAASPSLLSLAVDLEQMLAAATPGADLVVAPLPVAASLAQARSGAGGTTAESLDRVLHTPTGIDGAAELASGLSSLERILASRAGEQRAASGRSGTVSLDLAQSLWLQRGTALEDPWLDGLATTWGTGVRTTDFRSDAETARKAVNTWMADATDDHIVQLAPRGSISTTTRVLAAGAAYLKAPWVTPFAETETRLGPFVHLDGSTTTASYLRNPAHDDVRYGRGDGWLAVDIPYLGRSLWMTVLVPDPGRFAAVEGALDGEVLAELIAGLAPAVLDLRLPKFAFTTDVPLTEALRSLGLDEAMDPLTADFGAISPEALWLTSVLHQTYLAIDEEGTEAVGTPPERPSSTTSSSTTPSTTTPSTTTPGSAATAEAAGVAGAESPTTTSTTVGVTPQSAAGAMVVTVDRPFLVLVRDRPTGAPLFYGRVLSPNG